MDVSAVGQSQNLINSEIKAEQTKEAYAVKLIKMSQESEEVVGNLIEDTVEFSKEAMDKYLSEVNAGK